MQQKKSKKEKRGRKPHQLKTCLYLFQNLKIKRKSGKYSNQVEIQLENSGV